MKTSKTIYLAIVLTIGILTINSCGNDDDCTEQTWYQDADGDGFGNVNMSQSSCTQPTGYVSDNTDFDDLNSDAYPGAVENCNDGIDNDGDGNIDNCIIDEILGNWTDNFGTTYVINNTTLTLASMSVTDIFHIQMQGENFVICQNDASNNYNPNLYSKFLITNLSANEFYLCQSFYDSPSQISIENATDPSDLNDLTSGCGGFSWAQVTRD